MYIFRPLLFDSGEGFLGERDANDDPLTAASCPS
jgi:hypothetical protein